VILLLPLLAIVAPPTRAQSTVLILQMLGLACLVLCAFGRIWAALYVAGRKDYQLVTIGPYSVVRNPLYVFSFVGLLGIGLISQVMTFLVLGLLGFATYYRAIVAREEQQMARIHGSAFARYMTAVPRWFPKFSQWRHAPLLEVDPNCILRRLLDSGMFFLSFILFAVLQYLHSTELIPVILVLP
jgi:protein-S-isoprenylcysteine O-methyltransferase Ste14